jgi:hypothetical protein
MFFFSILFNINITIITILIVFIITFLLGDITISVFTITNYYAAVSFKSFSVTCKMISELVEGELMDKDCIIFGTQPHKLVFFFLVNILFSQGV